MIEEARIPPLRPFRFRSGLQSSPSALQFGIIDQKGRVAIPKEARNALGVKPGSHVAYVVLDGALMIVPEDEHLAELKRQFEEAQAKE